MATKLTHAIRREIIIDDEPFTIVISPQMACGYRASGSAPDAS